MLGKIALRRGCHPSENIKNGNIQEGENLSSAAKAISAQVKLVLVTNHGIVVEHSFKNFPTTTIHITKNRQYS